MEARHGAIIKVDKELIAEILDFEGAIIHMVYEPDAFIEPTYFCVVVEHPDLPLVPQNETLPEIAPIMKSWYGKNGSLLKIARIDPPKLRPTGFMDN